jgi:hypothetical protein
MIQCTTGENDTLWRTDNIKVRYQPVRDTSLPDPGGLNSKIDGVALKATDI